MYIKNGIVYAGEPAPMLGVEAAKVLDDKIIIITFDTGETRLFDATILLDGPAFQPLKDDEIFKAAKVVGGVLTWCDGTIDISANSLYENSYPYQSPDSEAWLFM
ncbi:MAG: DUF2442 domain-containing protein [Clostridiales bacterium]|jgi:hypothetical protein|nr:DUF2442 domain-containing protein [Clostridiales bacterium]